MQWLAELCVKRPVFATVLSLVILVVGGVFYTKLGVDQFPKIDFPVIVVITRLPGHEQYVHELGCDRELILKAGRWTVAPLKI